MIAEIYGKISNSGSNLTERLEDELTGNFFGTMRYIPFNKGIKQILKNCVYPLELSELLDGLDMSAWDSNISFWHREKEAEIDVLITFDELIVGIEVKYTSPLSSDDNVDNSDSLQGEEDISCQQLARESRLLERLANNKNKILLLLADESSSYQIYTDTLKRRLLGNVHFGYITWQKILIELENIHIDNPFEETIINDLIALLTRKGFKRFSDFSFKAKIVNPKMLWAFEYKIDDGFHFLFDNKIEWGLYYEFRK